MKKEIIERTVKEANYMVKTNETIRQIAKVFNVSKSTVHKDLQDRLKNLDKKTYLQIKKILKRHIQTRHIKGGQSTKKKYLKLSS